jgi:hypothetical protein
MASVIDERHGSPIPAKIQETGAARITMLVRPVRPSMNVPHDALARRLQVKNDSRAFRAGAAKRHAVIAKVFRIG